MGPSGTLAEPVVRILNFIEQRQIYSLLEIIPNFYVFCKCNYKLSVILNMKRDLTEEESKLTLLPTDSKK